MNNIINLINNSLINIPRQKIKSSEDKYKKIESQYDSYDFDNDSDFNWNKLFLEECKKQFNIHKGLQPGKTIELCAISVLCELLFNNDYEYSSDINKFKDILSEDDLYKSKHICYKNNVYIISKGDPKSEDIRIIYKDKIIRIEIKDFNANCFDSDLYYDENGKLLLINNGHKLINEVISQFNKETNIIDHCGKNYKFMPSKEFIDCIIKDYNDRNIDFIMILSKYKKEYRFNAVKINDLNISKISMKGSEIRTSGKNYSNVFCPHLLNNCINILNISYDNLTRNCKIYKNNTKTIGFIKGRHKDEYTRYKINHQFIIKTKDITEFDNYYEFQYNKIKQIKPSIQLHISIKI